MTTMHAVCRCGTDLKVVKGGATFCEHCDRPCLKGNACPSCSTLNRTCTDCRTRYHSEQRRAECEATHTLRG